jgi:putative copper resistance protein D
MTAMPMGQFSWHHLNQWHFMLIGSVIEVLAVTGYLCGVRRVSNWSPWRTAWFIAAIAVITLTTSSVIGVYDMSYFSDHMIEHLLLIMLAAPLLALSRPLDLLYEAGGTRTRALLDSSAMAVVTHPLFAFAAYFIIIPVAHLTGFLSLMMHHPAVHHVEQGLFVLVGYLFFRVAFGAERGRHLHPGLRVVFVMAAVPVDTFTGLALVMSSHLPFSDYLSMTPMGTTSAAALNIFHLGGAIMWIGGDALMLLACIPMVVQWVRWETANTKLVDAELDRLGI